ncbi:phosphoribosylformylglycinamidine synthase subunit PurL [Parvularcula mediterranea]|nr:phosphoribosylformylglycinamidine synthase subunit PurL [Parvularcula mediterranea]
MTHSAETIAEHGLTPEEYDRFKTSIGREPSMLELGIVSVMWSEHCSYKSSRRHLKTLPTEGPQVIHGPGENAGVVDIGDGQAVIFKMESHNHPSFIEPYQGAATGVGGIMRDVFTMGARPVALLNALRFGAIDHPKTKHLLSGVVAGIGGYGNCMGVPTVGGETGFDPRYNGNILVNAMCVGIADTDKIFLSAAKGAGNPVVYVGSKTGRDGIHGATMASAEFDEASEEKRPTVQVGDPFMEKLLLEACLELMAEDAIVAIQDMGAAGLTSSSVEMASGGLAAGEGGLHLKLDDVPQREDGMTAYEMMLSESQERMLMVLKPGAEDKARAIFDKWEVDFAVIGHTTDTGRLVIEHKGEIECDLPLEPLADEAPNYDRPQAELSEPAQLEDPVASFTDLQVSLTKGEQDLEQVAEALISETLSGKDGIGAVGISEGNGTLTIHARTSFGADSAVLDTFKTAAQNLEAAGAVAKVRAEDETVEVNLADQPGGDTMLLALRKLTASPDLCSRRWITQQYDHTVMADTLITGGDASVVRVHGTNKALGVTADCTPRYCAVAPYEGGKQAVAEACRNLSAVGAEPLAITNCLNFGNPEKPEIMAGFVGCIRGLGDAAKALGAPVVSGNVSLYNETDGSPIPHTPAIGAVGILRDQNKRATISGMESGDALIAIGVTRGHLGQSLYMRNLFGIEEGAPPAVDLELEKKTGDFIRKQIEDSAVSAVHDVSDGGLLVAASEMCLASGMGVALTTSISARKAAFWFGEDQARYLVSVPAETADSFVLKAAMAGLQASRLGIFGGEEIILDGQERIAVTDLAAAHEATIPELYRLEEDRLMPMKESEIKEMILTAMPDAEVEIEDLAGDGDHYRAVVRSNAFEGLTRIQQHQLVYRALGGKMGDTLHALALETQVKG